MPSPEPQDGDAGDPRRSWALKDLRPQWLADKPDDHKRRSGTRFGMGVSWLCTRHQGMDHRVECWFLNPLDRGPPMPGKLALYHVRGVELWGLTLTTGLVLARDKVLAQPIHAVCGFVGYLYDGRVIEAFG